MKMALHCKNCKQTKREWFDWTFTILEHISRYCDHFFLYSCCSFLYVRLLPAPEVTKIPSIQYTLISGILGLVFACSLKFNLLTFFFCFFFWQCKSCPRSHIIIHVAPLMMQEATGFMRYSVGWLSACKSLSLLPQWTFLLFKMYLICSVQNKLQVIFSHLLLHTHAQSTIQIT